MKTKPTKEFHWIVSYYKWPASENRGLSDEEILYYYDMIPESLRKGAQE